MRIFALILGLASALMGCGDYSVTARTLLLSQIESYNAAGVDPIQLHGEELRYMVLACSSASAIVTVIDPTKPELSAEASEWCKVLAKAAAKASAPKPPPKPPVILRDKSAWGSPCPCQARLLDISPCDDPEGKRQGIHIPVGRRTPCMA